MFDKCYGVSMLTFVIAICNYILVHARNICWGRCFGDDDNGICETFCGVSMIGLNCVRADWYIVLCYILCILVLMRCLIVNDSVDFTGTLC